MPMTEQQKEKLQICEGTIAGVKRIDKQIIEEPREEVGVKESFTRKLVVSWLKGLERRRERSRRSIPEYGGDLISGTNFLLPLN